MYFSGVFFVTDQDKVAHNKFKKEKIFKLYPQKQIWKAGHTSLRLHSVELTFFASSLGNITTMSLKLDSHLDLGQDFDMAIVEKTIVW